MFVRDNSSSNDKTAEIIAVPFSSSPSAACVSPLHIIPYYNPMLVCVLFYCVSKCLNHFNKVLRSVLSGIDTLCSSISGWPLDNCYEAYKLLIKYNICCITSKYVSIAMLPCTRTRSSKGTGQWFMHCLCLMLAIFYNHDFVAVDCTAVFR